MHRIAQLPRRQWRELEHESVSLLSDCLRTPKGKQFLRAIQAVGLREAMELGGAYIMGRVGVGKTLITLLAGELMQEERVLILVPEGALAKTEDEFDEYREHWNGVHAIKYKIHGYGEISRMPKKGESIQGLWSGLGPSLIICDEADKLRRVDPTKGASGLALQVNDYLVANPHCKMIALTGTPDKESIKDYSHILQWCLRDGSPLPTNWDDLCDWSDVIDNGDPRCAKKVCIQLGIPHTADTDKIREAYQQRLRETPGVIISDDQFPGPLSFECHLAPPWGMEEHFYQLRKKYQRPDGWDLLPEGPSEDEERAPDRIAAQSIWGVERQLALGFCYVADPVPPKDWMEARRLYFKAVRIEIRQRRYYTEAQVRAAGARKQLKPAHQKAYETWEAMRPTFEPGSKCLWLSDHALELCEDWGQEPGIIWVDHIAFGNKLSERTGWRYFQSGGKDRRGARIEKASGSETIIASRFANSTGRNLQAWNRNFVSAVPSNNRDFEQMVGREHREGQLRAVSVDILLGCKAHVESVQKILLDAARQTATLMKQKASVFPWAPMPETPKGLFFND